MTFFRRFLVKDDGAVTVDWVVLTAAVVVLAVAVSTTLQAPIENEVDQIATIIEDTTN